MKNFPAAVPEIPVIDMDKAHAGTIYQIDRIRGGVHRRAEAAKLVFAASSLRDVDMHDDGAAGSDESAQIVEHRFDALGDAVLEHFHAEHQIVPMGVALVELIDSDERDASDVREVAGHYVARDAPVDQLVYALDENPVSAAVVDERPASEGIHQTARELEPASVAPAHDP